MKIREIEINGKIYRTKPVDDKSDIVICNNCDLQSQCFTDLDIEIRDMCLNSDVEYYFKEVKQKQNTNIKFYKFSSGTVFNVNHIKHIINMGYVKVCAMDPTKYEFSILLTNAVAIHVRFNSRAIANRERNKFIKFIEEYGYANNSN